MADDVKIITIVLDEDELKVDYSGVSIYEAYGLIVGSEVVLRAELECGENDENDET